jgi:hypothetical protein
MSIKLTYFNIQGAAEKVRLALALKGWLLVLATCSCSFNLSNLLLLWLLATLCAWCSPAMQPGATAQRCTPALSVFLFPLLLSRLCLLAGTTAHRTHALSIYNAKALRSRTSEWTESSGTRSFPLTRLYRNTRSLQNHST